GNRALGDRLESYADARAIETALTVLLLAPSIPMLFMGEEWGSKAPFPFFCDFGGDLADAVRKGRRAEYAWAYAEFGDEVPDALDPSTRDSAVLNWNERDVPAARKRLTLVRDLLKVRRREIVPRLAGTAFGEAHAANRLLTVHWRMGDGATLRLLANLSDQAISHAPGLPAGTLIWGSELGGEEGFERLSAVLRQHDLGLILDFVPNHVGVHYDDNPRWLDVLEWGPASPHAASFDIDWEQLPYRARGGVLLPIIGSSYGQALENGEIELRYDAGEGSFSAWYFEHRLPIAPERYGEILRMIVKEAGAEEGGPGKEMLALASRHQGPRRPSRREAPAFKAELKAISGAADIIARG